MLLDAVAGNRPGDPYRALPLPPGHTFLRQADRDPGRFRIGRYAIPASRAEIDPACVAVWQDAASLLVGLGHDVVDLVVPFDPEIGGLFVIVWAVKLLKQSVPDEDLLWPVAGPGGRMAALSAARRTQAAGEWLVTQPRPSQNCGP